MLNSSEERGKDYKKMIEEYNKMISEVKKLLDNKGPIPQLSNLVKHLEKLQKRLVDVTEGYTESLETQINIHKKLTESIDRGGLPGFSTLSQIDATKNIAIAAACLAISSVSFSVSSVIISSVIISIVK